jgi:peroxiredoxin
MRNAGINSKQREMTMKTAIILVLLCVLSVSVAAQEIQTRKAPDFTLPDIEGRNYALAKNLGRGPVYISFWATWCRPCVEELKIIQKLYEKYEEDGFQVVAINIEGPKASAKVKSFVKSYGLTFTILLDNDGEVFRRKFKGAAMPFTLLTDSEGTVVFSAVGFKPGDEAEIEKKIIENLIVPPDTSTAQPADTAVQPGSEQ